jgi:hypothetical protein
MTNWWNEQNNWLIVWRPFYPAELATLAWILSWEKILSRMYLSR